MTEGIAQVHVSRFVHLTGCLPVPLEAHEFEPLGEAILLPPLVADGTQIDEFETHRQGSNAQETCPVDLGFSQPLAPIV
jgi:hypothetical protein